MSDIDAALGENQAAVAELVAAARTAAARWTVQPAPGRWSPSQVAEHVARALEESALVVAGAPSKFPTLPGFVRPVVRGLFFRRVLKKNGFPKARTSKPFNPETGSASPGEARTRLEGALAAFDRACRTRAASGTPVPSTIFGQVRVEDYARFQAIHTRHHCRQMA